MVIINKVEQLLLPGREVAEIMLEFRHGWAIKSVLLLIQIRLMFLTLISGLDGSMDAVLATEYLTSRDEEIVDSSTTKVHKEDIQIKEDSKYRGKEKVLRPWLKRPQDRLITNQATINKVPG